MLRLLAQAEAYCPAPVVGRFAAALAAAPALPPHAAVDGVWAMLRLDWQVRPWSHSAPPPPSRTKWTRLIHPSVLIGHVL
jgi:hypothetical protein